jgi:hypothetical protein
MNKYRRTIEVEYTTATPPDVEQTYHITDSWLCGDLCLPRGALKVISEKVMLVSPTPPRVEDMEHFVILIIRPLVVLDVSVLV